MVKFVFVAVHKGIPNEYVTRYLGTPLLCPNTTEKRKFGHCSALARA